jgi:hypothetical protein
MEGRGESALRSYVEIGKARDVEIFEFEDYSKYPKKK